MFSSGCRRGILSLASGGGFNPLTLFAAGEQGGWWDPSDFSTMFQDSAGTTPVTAVTQPVGKILDKSGRGNHRTQATAGSRPTLQVDGNGFFYLNYDGVDDFMQTGNVDFSATSVLNVWTGIYKASDAAAQIIIESGVDVGTTNGSFGVIIPGTANWQFGVRAATATAYQSPAAVAPLASVLQAKYDTTTAVAANQVASRQSGVASGAAVTGGSGAGNLASLPIYFGRRAGTSFPFTGREYGTIILGRTATVGEIAQGERFIGSRMGIAL